MEPELAVAAWQGGQTLVERLQDKDPEKKRDVDNLIAKIDRGVSEGTQQSLTDARGSCKQLERNYRINDTQAHRLGAIKDRADYHAAEGGGAGAAPRFAAVSTALATAQEKTKKKETKYLTQGKLRVINRDGKKSLHGE
jgi:hypothetical protein